MGNADAWEPVIVSREFNLPVRKIWEAITRPDLMRGWFFEGIPDFRPQAGFQISFPVESNGRVFIHQWKVTEAEPLKKIAYDWSYGGYPGASVVTFLLTENGGRTLLTLTHTVTEPFPEDIPEFKRESCLGGWKYFITESLPGFLNPLS